MFKSLTLAILLCSLATPSAQLVGHGNLLAVEARSHGVRLQLTLPRKSYPEKVFVRVTMRLENHSPAPCSPNAAAQRINQQLQKFGIQGVDLCPPYPIVHGTPNLPCKGGDGGFWLQPGQKYSSYEYLILLANRVRATVALQLTSDETPNSTTPLDLTTSFATIKFTKAQRLNVAIQRSVPVHAVFSAPKNKGVGGLHFMQWYKCADDGVFGRWTPHLWPTTTSTVLRPGCTDPLEWHAIVGMLNYSATYINYVKS